MEVRENNERDLLLRLHVQVLSRVVRAEGSSTLAVVFWPILLAVAGFAVDFIHMAGHRCAVQVLLTCH